ncbi:hypothetical protein [Clostridium sp. AM33-3]|uniref:hypothetical protein n=1 Tax=Clostridium sp. AM33-3 TaxID=2292304 RepID=UPI000E53E6DC|nr:hypothetical protein [Clostridium sp. AM33-3]RHT19039.1 hypothetical protein DW819_11790 [Clostridium sp. AM33-3]
MFDNDVLIIRHTLFSCNKCIQFLGEKGFVDPAMEDYDEHMEWREDGMIYGKTEKGRYMEEALEF